MTGLPVNVGLALRDPTLSASLIELLASAGMTVVDAAKNPGCGSCKTEKDFFADEIGQRFAGRIAAGSR